MDKTDLYALNEDHFYCFGALIQAFARCESLIGMVAANMVKLNLYETMILMSEHGYAGKRNTTKSLVAASNLPDKTKEKLQWFLGEVHKHNGLRNHIAHSVWVVGKRPKSVKPFGLSARSGKPLITGMRDEDSDYLIEELESQAQELNKTYNDFKDYLQAEGLWEST